MLLPSHRLGSLTPSSMEHPHMVHEGHQCDTRCKPGLSQPRQREMSLVLVQTCLMAICCSEPAKSLSLIQPKRAQRRHASHNR